MGADICGDKLCGIRDHNVLEQLPGEFTSLHFYLLRQIRFPDLQRQSSSRSLFYHVSFLSLSLSLSLSQYYILVALSCNVIKLVNGLVWIYLFIYLSFFFCGRIGCQNNINVCNVTTELENLGFVLRQ